MKKKSRGTKAATKKKRATTSRAGATGPGTRYWKALVNGGYLQGASGNQTIADGVSKLVSALHHVLAGGTITGTVPGNLNVTSGESSKVETLNRLGRTHLAAINKAGGPGKLTMMT